ELIHVDQQTATVSQHCYPVNQVKRSNRGYNLIIKEFCSIDAKNIQMRNIKGIGSIIEQPAILAPLLPRSQSSFKPMSLSFSIIRLHDQRDELADRKGTVFPLHKTVNG